MSSTIIIEGLEFTLFKEKDKDKLPRLSFKGRVEWFEKRVELVLINPLKELADNSFRNSLKKKDGNILLCFGTLICCGIESLGGFMAGRASFKGFKSFVKKYMDSRWQNILSYGLSYWRALRDDFRNGLAHGFTVQKGGFEASSNYFEEKEYGLEIDENLFFQDLEQAFQKYLRDLKNSKESGRIRKNFEKRFRDVFLRDFVPKPKTWFFRFMNYEINIKRPC